MDLKNWIEQHPPATFAGEPEKPGELIRWALGHRELQRRISVSLGIAILVYLFGLLPASGINFHLLAQFLGADSGHLQGAGLFDLGIAPFLLACSILQWVSVLIPPLRRWMFGAANGREKLFLLSYGVSLLIGGFFAAQITRATYEMGILTLAHPVLAVALVAGSQLAAMIVLLVLAAIVNRFGLGNGYALVFIVPLLSKLISVLSHVRKPPMAPLRGPYWSIIALTVAALACLCFALTRRRHSEWIAKTGDSGATQLPFRYSFAAAVPLDAAASLLLLPMTLSYFWPKSWFVQLSLHLQGARLHEVGFYLALIVLTWLFWKILYSPNYFPHTLRRLGYAYRAASRFFPLIATTVGFLALVHLAKFFLISAFAVPAGLTELLTGSSLLILVGFAHDWLAHAEFFRRRETSVQKDWRVCDTGIDESEAYAKLVALQGVGIAGLVEPIAFSWGMPIRTVIDCYRVHCPSEDYDRAVARLAAV